MWIDVWSSMQLTSADYQGMKLSGVLAALGAWSFLHFGFSLDKIDGLWVDRGFSGANFSRNHPRLSRTFPTTKDQNPADVNHHC